MTDRPSARMTARTFSKDLLFIVTSFVRFDVDLAKFQDDFQFFSGFHLHKMIYIRVG